MRHTASLVLVVGIVATATTPAPTAGQDDSAVRMVRPDGEGERYWPRWRGPSGQGVVDDTGYPDTWAATTNVLWKTSVPGSGSSSPIVNSGLFFLNQSQSRNGGVVASSCRLKPSLSLFCCSTGHVFTTI